MKDAELMTATETSQLISVIEHKTIWSVCVGCEAIALITEYHSTILGPRFSVPLKDGSGTRQFHTRNDAVQWILDQHKKGEK